MPEILIPARGCVYNPRKTRSGAGFYALDPSIRGNAESPILIDGIDSTDQDIIFPVTTLDEKKYLYVQGEDFGNIAIGGVALLGKAEQGGRAFRALIGYFNAHRINRSMAPITASFPGSVSQKVYLTAIVIAKPDPEFHIQPFQFRGIVAEPKKA